MELIQGVIAERSPEMLERFDVIFKILSSSKKVTSADISDLESCVFQEINDLTVSRSKVTNFKIHKSYSKLR